VPGSLPTPICGGALVVAGAAGGTAGIPTTMGADEPARELAPAEFVSTQLSRIVPTEPAVNVNVFTPPFVTPAGDPLIVAPALVEIASVVRAS